MEKSDVYRYFIAGQTLVLAGHQWIESHLKELKAEFSSIEEAYYEESIDGGVIIVITGVKKE